MMANQELNITPLSQAIDREIKRIQNPINNGEDEMIIEIEREMKIELEIIRSI